MRVPCVQVRDLDTSRVTASYRQYQVEKVNSSLVHHRTLALHWLNICIAEGKSMCSWHILSESRSHSTQEAASSLRLTLH